MSDFVAGVVIVYVERLSSKRWISGVDFLKNFGRLFGAETWSILSNRSGRGLLDSIEAGVVIVYVERLSSKRWISGVDFLKNFGRLFGAETWSILSNRSGRGLLEWSSAPLGSYRNLNLIPLVVVEEKLTVMEMAWPMCIGVVVMSASVFPAGSKRRSTSR